MGMDRDLAQQQLAEVHRRASFVAQGLTTPELIALAGVHATLALVEPPAVEVAVDEFLETVDPETLEAWALEHHEPGSGSLTAVMLERLRQLARGEQ